jgi:oligopeptide/dipeptide ABC transporter ATP-binding protein
MSVLLITHDLGVVAETADRVVVMYTGSKVEEGLVEDVFRSPLHPYTRGLITVSRWESTSGATMPEIRGFVPSPFEMPPGCSFAPRCDHAMDACRAGQPRRIELARSRSAACILVEPPA